jgi:YidC/Oxa1 family membrane protein insertase
MGVMEKRLLLAFVLSAVLFAVWSILFPPPEPPRPEDEPEGTPVVASPSPAVADATVAADSGEAAADETASEAGAEAVEAVTEVVAEAVAGSTEQRLLLENESLRIELSSRGAALTSVILKNYEGDEGEPLELVQPVDHPQRALPLQLLVDGEPDDRLYAVEADGDGYVLRWSDGRGAAVTKRMRLLDSGYGLAVNVELSSGVENARVAVGTGMRQTSEVERKNRFSGWGDVTLGVGPEVEKIARGKVKEPRQVDGAGVRFAGFGDSYFLSVIRPETPLREVDITPLEVEETTAEGEAESLKVVRVVLTPVGGELQGDYLAVPKEYDVLHDIGGTIQDTLHFGFFHPISVFFLKALRWIFELVGNWGVAIILLTLAIRIVLFPLMHKSTVSMRRMQKLQPKVKTIQEKYRKNKSDPQVRAKMNQEMMELYRAEGVNPMGGCLPMLLQLPILWALYMLFAYAIELRHAPFMLWITDLSAKDPLYITPVLMTATMWIQQKLAPQAGDPQQQRIMRLMPLIFGIMFLGFPSGLVLYWLSNNVITIIQQEVTFHLIGEGRFSDGGKGKSVGPKAEGGGKSKRRGDTQTKEKKR